MREHWICRWGDEKRPTLKAKPKNKKREKKSVSLSSTIRDKTKGKSQVFSFLFLVFCLDALLGRGKSSKNQT